MASENPDTIVVDVGRLKSAGDELLTVALEEPFACFKKSGATWYASVPICLHKPRPLCGKWANGMATFEIDYCGEFLGGARFDHPVSGITLKVGKDAFKLPGSYKALEDVRLFAGGLLPHILVYGLTFTLTAKCPEGTVCYLESYITTYPQQSIAIAARKVEATILSDPPVKVVLYRGVLTPTTTPTTSGEVKPTM